MRLLLTGASGYLGRMLLDSWCDDERVSSIVAIDRRPLELLPTTVKREKITFVCGELTSIDFEAICGPEPLNAVIHTAYDIRTPYWHWAQRRHEQTNRLSAERVFRFAFSRNVTKLIHCSTIAAYGARPDNDPAQPLTEAAPLREQTFAYGSRKRLIEDELRQLMAAQSNKTEAVILRIASVTGPLAQRLSSKRGLITWLKGLLPFVPITGDQALRQYLHEDDLVAAINFCLWRQLNAPLTTYNVAPDCHLTFIQIARRLRKRVVRIPYLLVRISFALAWHLSLGKIPTAPGSINSYTYPIRVDGSALIRAGFHYQYSCDDAFLAQKGKYCSFKISDQNKQG